MTGLFLFTLVFIIAQFFEKSDYDRMKEADQHLEVNMSNNKPIMTKYIIPYILIFFTNVCWSQNSIVGDGFGGRLWYKPTNLSSYSYGGFMICGPENRPTVVYEQ